MCTLSNEIKLRNSNKITNVFKYLVLIFALLLFEIISASQLVDAGVRLQTQTFNTDSPIARYTLEGKGVTSVSAFLCTPSLNDYSGYSFESEYYNKAMDYILVVDQKQDEKQYVREMDLFYTMEYDQKIYCYRVFYMTSNYKAYVQRNGSRYKNGLINNISLGLENLEDKGEVKNFEFLSIYNYSGTLYTYEDVRNDIVNNHSNSAASSPSVPTPNSIQVSFNAGSGSEVRYDHISGGSTYVYADIDITKFICGGTKEERAATCSHSADINMDFQVYSLIIYEDVSGSGWGYYSDVNIYDDYAWDNLGDKNIPTVEAYFSDSLGNHVSETYEVVDKTKTINVTVVASDRSGVDTKVGVGTGCNDVSLNNFKCVSARKSGTRITYTLNNFIGDTDIGAIGFNVYVKDLSGNAGTVTATLNKKIYVDNSAPKGQLKKQ